MESAREGLSRCEPEAFGAHDRRDDRAIGSGLLFEVMTRQGVSSAAPSERLELGGHEVHGRDGAHRDVAFEQMDDRFGECGLLAPAVVEAGPSKDGSVFLAGRTARDVALPGVTLRAREGAGPLAGDTPFLGLYMASRARAYLDNIPASRARKGIARRLSRAELEERLEGELSTRGGSYVNTLRDDARKLAPSLGLVEEFKDVGPAASRRRGRPARLAVVPRPKALAHSRIYELAACSRPSGRGGPL